MGAPEVRKRGAGTEEGRRRDGGETVGWRSACTGVRGWRELEEQGRRANEQSWAGSRHDGG
jgi:hypothetical protein